jgi:hypothetical protein
MPRRNIEQFCKQLAGKSDAVKRRAILRLLADEEAELVALKGPAREEEANRPRERKLRTVFRSS